MKSYTNLKRLIDWAERYERDLPEGEQWDDKKFSEWLSNEISMTQLSSEGLAETTKPAVSMFVYFLYKYALFYSRKILKNSRIYSLDDFSFLASLLPNKQLMKAEVIRKNISEKSSGNEVLKRLLRQKLIKETNNPNDGRSKLLEITPEGLNEINAVRSQFEKMGTLVAGDLTEIEKIILINMLSKLLQFHKPIFEANDEEFLNDLLGVKN